MNLIHKVKKTIEKERLIEDGDNVLVGLSGGIDSTALFYVLAELAKENSFKIGIAHVNHLLRGGESDRDQRFVEDLAAQFSIPCYAKRFDVKAYAKKKGISLQHAGRDMRYRFFDETALAYSYDKIAIAHNLDDQIETFVLRILKGTGVKGLASIPIKRDRIIRPFLNVYRAEIEEYVNAISIRYVEDSSNKKTKYERNYVRKEILPVMAKMNPAFKEKIFFLLQDITLINSFFEKRAASFSESQLNLEKDYNGVSFEIKELKRLDEETRFRVVVNTVAQLQPGFILLREHYRLVTKIFRSARPNLAAILPCNVKAVRIYDRLIFTKNNVMPVVNDVFPLATGENRIEPLMITVEIARQQSVCVPDNDLWKSIKESGGYIAFFDAEKTGSVFLRTFREGDRFMPLGMSGRVKLKDFFISRKIPRGKRQHIPLLVSDNDIIWVVGHRIDDRFKVTGHSREVLKVTVKPF